MKDLKVTISEFEKNGGILKEGREIFDREGSLIGYYKGFDDNQKVHLASNSNWRSFPITNHFHLVKIEIIPVWK